jgi:hypothetical protein
MQRQCVSRWLLLQEGEEEVTQPRVEVGRLDLTRLIGNFTDSNSHKVTLL